MALSAAIQRGATQLARQNQLRAELRLEEIIKVEGIADDYATVDRSGDLEMERHFGIMYHAAHSERMRELIVAAFLSWEKTERNEERVVRRSVDGTALMLRENNDVFLADGCGPTGRAA
jgi:hypothetical protein